MFTTRNLFMGRNIFMVSLWFAFPHALRSKQKLVEMKRHSFTQGPGIQEFKKSYKFYAL